MKSSVAVIIVAFGNPEEVKELVCAIGKQKKEGDRLIVVDNHPEHETAALLEDDKFVNKVIRSTNVGFGAGCNKGVRSVGQGIQKLLFLNPDTIPSDNLLEVARSYEGHRAWMPLLLLPSGRINSAGNVVHISGLSWLGHYNEVSGNASKSDSIDFLSGAGFVVDRDLWDEVGAMPENYFMYYEDTDFSTQLLLRGVSVGLVSEAWVTHNYDFKKGGHKWIYIERNRPLYIIRTWPIKVILVLLPLLLLCEILLWPISILQGRLTYKIKGAFLFWSGLAWAIRSRRQVMACSRISSYDFLQKLEYRLNSVQLGGLSRSRLVSSFFGLYYSFAKNLLRIIG